jgi:uncharacterized membrane protein
LDEQGYAYPIIYAVHFEGASESFEGTLAPPEDRGHAPAMSTERAVPDDGAVTLLREAIELSTIRWILTPPVVVVVSALWIPMLEETKSASYKVVTLPAFLADPDLFGSQGPVLLTGWLYLLLVAGCAGGAATVMLAPSRPTRMIANRVLLVSAPAAIVAAFALWNVASNLDPEQIDVQGAFVLAVLTPTWFLGAALAARRRVADLPTLW